MCTPAAGHERDAFVSAAMLPPIIFLFAATKYTDVHLVVSLIGLTALTLTRWYQAAPTTPPARFARTFLFGLLAGGAVLALALALA